MDEAFAYCRSEVRRFDRERYFSSLFAGEKGSRSLQSLYAFNLEIAKTRETVSEPMLGQIRLQWWREAIDGIYAGTPRSHAVVTALAHTIETCDLERIRFDRLIDGREFDLEDRQPHTLDELIAYTRKTSGELTCLALECLGPEGAEWETAGRNAGIAWALVGILLAIPFHARQSRCYLPKTLTDEHGLVPSALFAGKPPPVLNQIIAGLAHVAGRHLSSVADLGPGLGRNGVPAYSHLAVAKANLSQLTKAGHDVFAFRQLSPLGRQFRIAAASLRRRL